MKIALIESRSLAWYNDSDCSLSGRGQFGHSQRGQHPLTKSRTWHFGWGPMDGLVGNPSNYHQM